LALFVIAGLDPGLSGLNAANRYRLPLPLDGGGLGWGWLPKASGYRLQPRLFPGHRKTSLRSPPSPNPSPRWGRGFKSVLLEKSVPTSNKYRKQPRGKAPPSPSHFEPDRQTKREKSLSATFDLHHPGAPYKPAASPMVSPAILALRRKGAIYDHWGDNARLGTDQARLPPRAQDHPCVRL